MKQYTMEEFIEGKFAVKVNENNCKEFLEMCAKRGLRWGSGEKANEFVPNFDIFEEGVVIIHEMRPNGMRLAYMVFSYTGDGVPIIDYKDFVDEKAPACYQITITCDGTVTTATMVINGKKIKTAIARQNPEDKFDWRKGAKVAFDRLWDSQKKAEKQPEVREVKRYANLGEYIKIVDAESAYAENYHNGDILLVVEYYEGQRDGWVQAEGANVVIDPDEYVVLEGYRP